MENNGLWIITVEHKVYIIYLIRHNAYTSNCRPAGANDRLWNSGFVLGSLFGPKNNGIETRKRASICLEIDDGVICAGFLYVIGGLLCNALFRVTGRYLSQGTVLSFNAME